MNRKPSEIDKIYWRIIDIEEKLLATDDYLECDNGKYFIAVSEAWQNRRSYFRILEKMCPAGYIVGSSNLSNVSMHKIVNKDKYYDYREPIYDREKGIISVSGFNQSELKKVVKEFHHPEWENIIPFSFEAARCAETINYMYEKYGVDMFKMLSDYMHFCSVIYDCNTKTLIGGVSEPNSELTNLYYGYTRNNNNLMYSNKYALVDYYCDEVHKMPNNTYMINGELHLFKEKSEDEIEVKLKEILESEYGRKLIDELVTQKIDEYMSAHEGFRRVLK